MRRFTLTCLTAGMLAVAFAASASAQISDPVFKVTASSSLGSATFEANFADGTFSPATGIFTWTNPSKIDLIDPGNGNYIASIKGNTTIRTKLEADFGYQVDFGYLLDAGPATTKFSIVSSQLSFSTLATPEGRATTVMGVTDNDGNGATLTPTLAGPGAFLAQYNGLAPGGTTFATLLKSPIVAGPGGSMSASDAEPPVGFLKPIGVPVSSLSGLMEFTVTANDSASGQSNFRVLPEPSTLALLAFGALACVRRGRR